MDTTSLGTASVSACLIVLVIVLVVIVIARCPDCSCWGLRPCGRMRCCKGGSGAPAGAPAEPFMVNDHRTITLHYTNWCQYCKLMKPVWAQVKAATANSGIRYVELDEDVAKTPGITAYPTIIMVAENGRAARYDGSADFDTLLAWCVNPVNPTVSG